MPRHTRWTATAGAALTVLATTACSPATIVTGCASPAEQSGTPRSDAIAPEPVLLGELQLSDSGGDEFVQAAAARPDGGAYVVLTEALADRSRLLTIAPAGDEYEITGSVSLPSGNVTDLLPLSDDRLLMVGTLTGEDPGYGFSVVDPVSGSSADTVLMPAPSPESALVGDAVRSPDGRTLYVHLHTFVGEEDGTYDLVAADLATGEVLSRRDLTDDLGALTGFLPGTEMVALLPRPAGGVTLAVNAAESWSARDRSLPALLLYDAALEPVGAPVVLAAPEDGLVVSGTSAGSDGTTFLLLERNDPGSDTRVVAVPAGGSPTLATRFCAENDRWMSSLAVDPSQAWAVVPTLQGVRSLSLADVDGGKEGPRLTLDCLAEFDGHPDSWHSDASPGVHWMVPSEDASTLLVVGECDTGGLPPPMLWIVGI